MPRSPLNIGVRVVPLFHKWQWTLWMGIPTPPIAIALMRDYVSVGPVEWWDTDSVYISIAFPLQVGGVDIHISCDSDSCENLRQTIPQSGVSTPFIFSPEVRGLQPNFSGPADANIASLTLLQSSSRGSPTKFLQDTVDTSLLSGIASFGGFWTFVNGTFALFFGANIIYFAFGRRPLSALGVVHLFQRRALVRTWHENFPAIYTEGGLPGSENAGIVAFIRERLVDVGEDPRVSSQESDETEAQEPATSSSSPKISIDEEQHNPYDGIAGVSHQRPSSRPLGYILDEIPLLDVNISHGDAP
ncbi:hypothetical protein K438DRAFT_178497 [Mycena galopus ATCC 62051]|nr:hypothetical protein K438DRAFT_178497 [Mycena galopus ATCC 62051]